MHDDLAGMIERVQLSSCAICRDAYTALETLTRERDEARADLEKSANALMIAGKFIAEAKYSKDGEAAFKAVNDASGGKVLDAFLAKHT